MQPSASAQPASPPEGAPDPSEKAAHHVVSPAEPTPSSSTALSDPPPVDSPNAPQIQQPLSESGEPGEQQGDEEYYTDSYYSDYDYDDDQYPEDYGSNTEHNSGEEGDQGDNMPGRRRAGGPPRRQTDMTGVLTVDEKNDTSMLVNNITDKMMKQISKIFDSPPISPTNDHHPLQSWVPNFLHKKENNPPSAAPTTVSAPTPASTNLPAPSTTLAETPQDSSRPSTSGSKSYSKAHEIIEKEEKEAMTPQLGELKKEALAFFTKWRTALMSHIREIKVNEPGSSGPPAGRGGRGGRGASRGASRGRGVPPRAARGGRGGRLSVRTPNSTDSTTEADPELLRRYPPTPTPLCSLDLEKRKIILHTILLLCLGLESYSAYSRVLLLNLASSLHLPMRIFHADEVHVARSLGQHASEIDVDEILKERADQNKLSRRVKVGLAGVAGAAIIGVTGGLAAPLVAAGVGAVMGGLGLGATAAAGLLGTMAESGLVVGGLFGIYGARASAKTIDSYAKDILDFAFLPLHGQHRDEYVDAKQIQPEDRRLRLVIGISGWLTQREDVVTPWQCLGHQAEVYALRWEVANLLNMGNSLETVVKSTAWSLAKKEIITRTIFASLSEALWPLGLLKISKLIDNPWSVGMVRAEKAGFTLADALMRKVQGERPVSLIGYSLAARTIYACLMVLAERRQFGLIDSVVLMGAPAPSESRVWLALKSVVAGRLVNVYSENDYILGFLYRTSSLQFGVAGLQAIQGAEGVENCDVSSVVSGHLRYQYMVGSILKKIGWEDLNHEEVAKEEEALALLDEKFGKSDGSDAAGVTGASGLEKPMSGMKV